MDEITTTVTGRPATERQINFIKTLTNDRAVPVAGRSVEEARLIARHEDILGAKFVNTREASAVIDWLKPLPRANAPTQPEIGVYVLPTGTIVQAKPNKAKTNVYTKRWVEINGERLVDATEDRVHGEWEYAPELKALLDDDYRMTLEQAKAFILRYGQCARCGRQHTSESTADRPWTSSLRRRGSSATSA